MSVRTRNLIVQKISASSPDLTGRVLGVVAPDAVFHTSTSDLTCYVCLYEDKGLPPRSVTALRQNFVERWLITIVTKKEKDTGAVEDINDRLRREMRGYLNGYKPYGDGRMLVYQSGKPQFDRARLFWHSVYTFETCDDEDFDIEPLDLQNGAELALQNGYTLYVN
jgi:hypothetical protein